MSQTKSDEMKFCQIGHNVTHHKGWWIEWNCAVFLQAGKVLQLILRSGPMHWQNGFWYLKDSIILWMWDILIARSFLFLLEVFSIIFRSGVLQVFSMCLSDVFNIFVLIILQPNKCKGIIQSLSCSGTECFWVYFGVLKQCFQILLLPPRYPINFQSRIPAALCTLQNFIQKIDHNEGAIPTDSYQLLTHIFLPTLMMSMALLQRMITRQIRKLSNAGPIFLIRCGKATWTT